MLVYKHRVNYKTSTKYAELTETNIENTPTQSQLQKKHKMYKITRP